MSRNAVSLLLFLILTAILGIPLLSKNVAEAEPVKSNADLAMESSDYAVISNTLVLANNTIAVGVKTKSSKYQPKEVIKTIITAYTSTPAQTDDTPFITASGSYTRKGVAASNFLPIGTKIRVPKLFGGQVFVIEDRLNARYNDRIDIWLPTEKKALDFGLRVADIEIL